MDSSRRPIGWRATVLGEIGEISGGGTPSTANSLYWNGTIPWIVPSDVTRNGGLFISDAQRTITEAGLANSNAHLMPSGSVLMTSRATIGEVAINTEPMATNQGFINIKADPEQVSNEFLAYWIMRNKSVFLDRAHGVTFKEITKANFKTILISLPPLPEQRAIAHTLRAVQAAKEARERELALAQERRAALMQHLFAVGTRSEQTKKTETDAVPLTWRTSRFDGYCILQRGFDITKKEQRHGNVPVVSSGGISSYHDLARVKAPGVVIGRKGSLGTVHYLETDFWPHDTTLWVSDFKGNFPLFTAYFLETLHLNRFDSGASNPTLNRNTVHAIMVSFPDIDEQHQIAEVLHACDALIAGIKSELIVFDELFVALLDELITGRLFAGLPTS